MGGDTTLEIAFGALALLFVGCLFGAARTASRRTAALSTAAPFLAWSGYESLVGRIMPSADIRLDWMLLVPLAFGLVATLALRWRRLD
ncbi:MAG: hypothetical protein HKP30_05605 [Myxococcales bacterium]|nr:hypothetical protein [Myxococcales bacterium]